jgi:hypothetical protein
MPTNPRSADMSIPTKQPFPYKILLACFVIAAAFIAVCSKSSFIYPINDWGDANAYITVARMMMNGRVLYADVFEQKGLYLYVFHILATLISYPSFFGVYLMETLTMTFFLFFAYRSLSLYFPLRLILPVMPLLVFSVAASLALTHGDSAEELMLPFLSYSLYTMLQWAGEEKWGKLPKGSWVLQGIVTAIIFWTKYTILGFHIGFCVAILICAVRNKDYKGLLEIIGLWLIGIVIGSLPALLYFGLTGSFSDLFAVYFKSNVVHYAGDAYKTIGDQFTQRWGEGTFLYFGRILLGFLGSPLMTGLAVAGFWGLGFSCRNPHVKQRTAVRCVYASMLLLLITLPVVYNYYFLPLGVLAVLGFRYFLSLVKPSAWPSMTLKRSIVITILIMAVLMPRSLASSQNGYLLIYGRSDLPQYQFRDIIHQTPNPTLLTHVNMDHGFQNVAEIVPEHKYFIATNTYLPERAQAWREMVMEGQVDYIISNNQKLEELYPGMPYDLVKTMPHPYEGEVCIYRLYRLKRLAI